MSGTTDRLSSALTRPGEHPVKRWFLLTGSRPRVVLALMALVFLVLITLALLWPIEMRTLLDETTAARTLFSSLLSGAILLVSIVVSINSITLSQEITDIDDQRKRIDASMEYRKQVQEFVRTPVTPARPADFISAVLFAMSNQVSSLLEHVDGDAHPEYADELEQYATEVSNEIDTARETLTGANQGSFEVLLAGLNYDYSGQLQATQSLKESYREDLSEEELECFDELTDTLKYIGTGRAYFKSLYYKRELSKLSSQLLYVSLPVIVFTSYIILAVDADFIPEITAFGIPPLVLALAFAYTIALAPYVLLTAYVIRAAAITLRTLAAGPFVLQRGSDITAFEWEGVDPSRDWDLSEHLDD